MKMGLKIIIKLKIGKKMMMRRMTTNLSIND